MPGPSETPANLERLLEQLALEPDSRRRRQLLQAGREWWKPETMARLYDEVVRLARIDLRQAERLARAAALDLRADRRRRLPGSQPEGHGTRLLPQTQVRTGARALPGGSGHL